MPETHQIAVKLSADAFARLKLLSATTGKTYAEVIASALMRGASSRLAETSALIIYPLLPDADRRAWKQKIRALRASGNSFNAIGKRMFHDYRLVGADGLPLAASTVRGICAA